MKGSHVIHPTPVAPKKLPPNVTTPQLPSKAPRTRTVDNFSFVFEGKTYQAGSAREVMVKVFQLIANSDSGFLERFASRKHGKKRRYIARDKMELYPGRPDLAEEHSVEVMPGWWMGTNYSRSNIQQILDLALEVVQPSLRSSLKVNVQ